MIFRGLISSDANQETGLFVVRGFAKLSALKKFSHAKDYQREIIKSHLTEINSFYKHSPNWFIPEITLSVELKGNEIKDSYTLLRNATKGEEVNTSNGIKIKTLKPRYNGDIIKIVTLSVNKLELMGRIDGNHRLEAFDTTIHKDKEVPFSIIIFSTDNMRKQEKTLFHNINSKVEPLRTEEVLSSIITDEDSFPDSELESEFGNAYLFSRKHSKLDLDVSVPLLSRQLRNFKISAFEKIYTLLTEYKFDDVPDGLDDVLRDIEFIYKKNKALHSNINPSVCISFIFYAIYMPDKLNQFENWILKNYFHEIPEITSERIIQLFENLTRHRKLKIFVAMPYWSHAHINEYNKLFKETLKEIEQEKNIFYELFPIMRHRGESQRIDQRLLTQIRECDIFIADLTGINQNVLYETAYAEGLDKPSLLIRAEEDEKEKKLPFDMTQRQYVPYPKGAYYNSIKNILKNNLPVIIERHHNSKLKQV